MMDDREKGDSPDSVRGRRTNVFVGHIKQGREKTLNREI